MQDRCVKNNKFVEAELCKTRIEQFKKKEQEKLLEELKNYHIREREQLDLEKLDRLESFNRDQDEIYYKLRETYENKEKILLETQAKEIDDKKKELEDELSNLVPKPSVEAINLNSILENLKKQKEFSKAHDVQIQLTNVVLLDQERIKNENKKKIEIELSKLDSKHTNELNGFKSKMKLAYDEYKKNRAILYDK